MLPFITTFFTIESKDTKIKNDVPTLDEFLTTSLGSIEAKGFASGTNPEKETNVNVKQNDNGIFSTFYNMAVNYVVELVAPLIQSVVHYARNYFEEDCSKYLSDYSLTVNNPKNLNDNNQSVKENNYENLNNELAGNCSDYDGE